MVAGGRFELTTFGFIPAGVNPEFGTPDDLLSFVDEATPQSLEAPCIAAAEIQETLISAYGILGGAFSADRPRSSFASD
jgi:hypothetical protein